MRDELEPIWNRVRAELRRSASDLSFHTWLEPLELAAVRDGTLYVRAPEHVRSWVTERYLPLLCSAAQQRLGGQATVELVRSDWEASKTEGRKPSSHAPGQERLTPRFSFEQFVIGAGNRLAHAAALAVAELPGQAYNPLLIHGAPGLGKTHLLQAIGNYVVRYGGGLRVRYATVEEFTTEFVEAVRLQRTAEFKERFRNVDVLLVDDVQFLAHKDRTCEEFFHTFNALWESGRQLVLTSDQPPDRLPYLEKRLAERFRAGLVVSLDPPEVAVREAILRTRVRLDGLEVASDVLAEIASCVHTSVRALEGALIGVVAHASLEEVAPTREIVRQVVNGQPCSKRSPSFTLESIVHATAEEFQVPRERLLSRDRRPDATLARQVAMYIARELTDHSLPEIGRGLGGRNHATVLHAVQKIRTALDHDANFNARINRARTRLESPL